MQDCQQVGFAELSEECSSVLSPSCGTWVFEGMFRAQPTSRCCLDQ